MEREKTEVGSLGLACVRDRKERPGRERVAFNSEYLVLVIPSSIVQSSTQLVYRCLHDVSIISHYLQPLPSQVEVSPHFLQL